MNSEEMSGLSPGLVMIAGDWHGNGPWAANAIHKGSDMIAEKEGQGHDSRKLILQLGDFGIGDWGTPGDNRRYLQRVNEALEVNNAHLVFIDGNHEDYHILKKFREKDPSEICSVRDNISWATRGSRWTWHNKEWLALGGAASVDKAVREPGKSWWPEEEITLAEAAFASAKTAQVMLTHDCPGTIVHSFANAPSWFTAEDIANAEAHRMLLHRICMEVKPQYLFHGHLHRGYHRRVNPGWGMTEIVGLNCDGAKNNWIILNTATMEWGTE